MLSHTQPTQRLTHSSVQLAPSLETQAERNQKRSGEKDWISSCLLCFWLVCLDGGGGCMRVYQCVCDGALWSSFLLLESNETKSNPPTRSPLHAEPEGRGLAGPVGDEGRVQVPVPPLEVAGLFLFLFCLRWREEEESDDAILLITTITTRPPKEGKCILPPLFGPQILSEKEETHDSPGSARRPRRP